jgi:hypothetical protein
MRFRSMILLSSLALAACGRSTPAAPPADAARLRAFGTVIATSTEAYLSRSVSMPGSAACREARNGYEDLVRPAIEGILAIGPGLDQRVRSRGPEEHADVECGAGAMLAEFERHTDIACTSLDLATNRAETARHAVTMGRWAALAVARADEGGTAAGESGPHCVRFSDGERVYLP